MASLARFKSDLTKINEGTWVTLDENYGEIEIKTRGFTNAYNDARGARIRRAALRFGGDALKIPTSDVRAILVELLIKHCLLDVRNLEDEKGQPVSFALFCELLNEDAYSDLYGAALAAANQVSTEREQDLAESKKSSLKPSA